MADIPQGQGGSGPGQVPRVRHRGRAAQHRSQEVLHEPGHSDHRRLRDVRVRRRPQCLQQRQFPTGQRGPDAAGFPHETRRRRQHGRGRDLHGRQARFHGLPERPGEDQGDEGREQLAAQRRFGKDRFRGIPLCDGQDQGVGHYGRWREHPACAHRTAGEAGMPRVEQCYAYW